MGKRTPTREALERGRRIKSVRNCNHLTQEKMAEKMNISVSTVKKMESGENNITISELKYLRDEFDVSADYILFGDSGYNM